MLGFDNNRRESDLPLVRLAGKCMTRDRLDMESLFLMDFLMRYFSWN